MQMVEGRVDPIKVPKLPFDIISEILSWLPVESLLRFRCVCKQWCLLLTQDHQFIAIHSHRASPLTLQRMSSPGHILYDKNFKFLYHLSGGLLLEMSLKNSRVYRIRNPVIHQVLYLPDAHEGTDQIDIAFNSFTLECKVVCVHGEDGEEVGFEVLTVGKDEQWRPLKHPNQDLLKQHGKQALKQKYWPAACKAKGLGHFTQLISDGKDLYMEIQSLDIWSERFTTNTVPRGFFADLNEVSVLTWNHCLAVRNITEENLNVLVLEDFKEHKWSQNKIIVPLTFLKDHPEWKDEILHAIGTPKSDVLQLAINYVYTDGITKTIILVDYDMSSQTVILKRKPPLLFPYPLPESCSHNPSLIALKGMKSEKAGFSPGDGFLIWLL